MDNFSNPLFWAVLIGWVLSVTLHEFAHGLVAYLGGDYTIRERGGLSLNPIHYVDPVMSLILPMVIFLIGGIPLPGGVTYVHDDLLRNRGWKTAVSAAGPAMNLLLFLILSLALQPRAGWIVAGSSPATWTNAQLFVATMAVLQLLAVLLNLIPVPPLDGFQMISPFLKEDLRLRLTTPPLSSMLFFGYFLLLSSAPGFLEHIWRVMEAIIRAVGLDADQLGAAYSLTLFGA